MRVKFLNKFFIFILFLIFGFSDFISFLPETARNNHLAKKFIINKAQAASVVYSVPWASGAEGFVWVSESCSGICTQGFTAADGNPAGSVFAGIVGRNKKSAGYWKKSLTWEDMGVPAGAAVTAVDGRFDVKLAQETNPTAHLAGLKIFDSTDAITVLSGGAADVETEFDPTSSSWTTRNVDGAKTIGLAYQSSNTFVTIRMREDVNSGNNASASSEIRVDNLVFIITYTAGGPDAASFVNNTESALADGGRSSQQITVTGTGFGAGPSNGTTNAVKIGTYIVPNGNVSVWSPTTITFTFPSDAGGYADIYGGAGINGLIIRAGGVDDVTPLGFYIYPNIIAPTPGSGQIGSLIAISGDHFGASGAPGALKINGATVIPAGWSEAILADARIPGQTGIVNGQIEVINDASFGGKNAIYNFTVSGPTVTGSNPTWGDKGQTARLITFFGAGIDTEDIAGNAPTLVLKKSGYSDIPINANSFGLDNNYTEVHAEFDLSQAESTGVWDLVIINMDGLYGTCGGCFDIDEEFKVTGMDPNFGLNTENKNINFITGAGFKNGAIAKLNNGADINSIPAFIFTDATKLSGGAFDLSGQAAGFWDVLVVNPAPDSRTAAYSNGFEIRSSLPTAPDPNKLYQFKASGDDADPPSENIEVGGGISGQNNIYFRMDMSGGTIGDYYPQVEIKPVGAAFDGIFIEGDPVGFTGSAVKGWVNIASLADGFYHWQARVKNSAGASAWVSFGANNDPNDRDVYIDNTLPEIYQNIIGDDACLGAAISITDLSAVIRWNTSDDASGAQNPPGSGSYAKVQVDFKKGFAPWTTTSLSAWENSLHQVALSGLTPAAIYAFRMRSQDYAGNERISPECNFTTTSSRPIKTVEFFIGQETLQNAGGALNRIAKDFSIYIPESPDEEISVKSAFIEISGISSDGAQAINAELRRGLGASFTGIGTSYNIDSVGTTTPFVILFDALNPNEAEGNESMADITQGASGYDYTLFLSNAGGVSVSVYSAKLIITYSYSQ